jgi:Fe-S cluster biogenesis protein NfuA
LFVNPVEDQQFLQRMQRIERLIQEMERFPDPAVQTMVREIVQGLLELHGVGLASILDHLVRAGEPGRALFATLADDTLVANLLLLHGIHPEGIEARVRRALDKVRPALRSHGGSAELLEVVEGEVRLRLASTAPALKQCLEEAVLAAAPDATAIEIAEEQATFIPVEELTLRMVSEGG